MVGGGGDGEGGGGGARSPPNSEATRKMCYCRLGGGSEDSTLQSDSEDVQLPFDGAMGRLWLTRPFWRLLATDLSSSMPAYGAQACTNAPPRTQTLTTQVQLILRPFYDLKVSRAIISCDTSR